MIEAETVADSLSPGGVRLTTLAVTMPRFILAQFNTHRMFSRNAASSRALRTEKLIEQVRTNPVMPMSWGTAQKGMVAGLPLDAADEATAKHTWLYARDDAACRAEAMHRLGVAKEIVNRILEPWLWTRVLVTATEWANFFKLRIAHDAQPEMQAVARAMKAVMEASPSPANSVGWHIPYDSKEGDLSDRIKASVARCARVSYLLDHKTPSLAEDIALHDRLLYSGHLSPFEHVACPAPREYEMHANLKGWQSYRYHQEKGWPVP